VNQGSSAAWKWHDRLRDQVWHHASRLRRWRQADAAPAIPGRVLHVTTSFDLGGTQTQIKHLCTARSTRFDHRPIEIFPELNYLFRQGAAVEADRYLRGGPLAKIAGRMVVNRSRRASHLVQVYKLVRDFRAERPGVVVGWGHEVCVTTFIAAAIARVPHIVFCIRTFNPDFGWTDPGFAALLWSTHQRMAAHVSRVVVNSTLLRDDHAQWAGMNADAIAVCANGIDVRPPAPVEAATSRARIRAAFGIADAALVLTNVGRFSKEKGQLSLVDANRRLLAAGAPAFVWLLCGDGPTLADVQDAAARDGMTNMVFAGRTREVPDVLTASDIFVMPSDFEGMPNALMEAMAHALPCVSTSRSGARDVARDGLEALYYEPGDTARLAQHLLDLMRDPGRARSLGAAAAARVGEFGVSRFVDGFDAILDSLPSTAS
jgi:glycosyltransferase involved in cell wall biosynthesis